MAQSQDEIFDVVDGLDRVVAQARRGDIHRRGLLHRAVHCCLFNPSGQCLLQRRSLLKDSSPGKWTTSCSGHVDAGEDYLGAARRELAEELGLGPVVADTLAEALYARPCAETGWEFVRVYRGCFAEGGGECLRPDPAEVSDVRWLTPADIGTWLQREPEAFATSFRYLWARPGFPRQA